MNSSSIFSYSSDLSESEKIIEQVGGDIRESSSDLTSDDSYHIQFGGNKLTPNLQKNNIIQRTSRDNFFGKTHNLNKIAINRRQLRKFEHKLNNKNIKINSRRKLKQMFVKKTFYL